MAPSPTPEPWRSTPPNDLLAAAWLAGYSSPKTRRTYQTMIRSWFDWCGLCGLQPLAARRAHVELWQRLLEQHGYAERTIALKLTAIASFYRYCEQEDLVARTPLACVRRPRIERLSPRGALTRGQVHDLLAGAERLGVHPYGLCCLLALNGLRIGEAAGLNVEDLDYQGLFPVLRFVRKGGRTATAVLARPTDDAVSACIADRRAGGDRVVIVDEEAQHFFAFGDVGNRQVVGHGGVEVLEARIGPPVAAWRTTGATTRAPSVAVMGPGTPFPDGRRSQPAGGRRRR